MKIWPKSRRKRSNSPMPAKARIGPVLETTLDMTRAPRVDGGDFFSPFVASEAEVGDAFARQKRDEAKPRQSQQFRGFAPRDTVFLKQTQDDVFPDGDSGLGLRAQQSEKFARQRNGE